MKIMKKKGISTEITQKAQTMHRCCITFGPLGFVEECLISPKGDGIAGWNLSNTANRPQIRYGSQNVHS